MGWLRSFPGGLFTTCGLDQFGSPSEDAGEQFGIHGRVSNLPAEQVGYREGWDGDEYTLEITGQVRQTRLFGENLVLSRRIQTRLGANRLLVEDTVTNEGFEPQPHMILYHCNFGYPLLSEDAELHVKAAHTHARDDVARAGLAHWNRFQPPTPGYSEQVFRHEIQPDDDGMASVQLRNPALGLALRLRYSHQTLPHLFQWKMMGQGAYVLGIEPANSSGIGGRAIARERNDLPHLAPGESRQYTLSFEVMDL
jgi:galactose mutarotase-like enzyme